MSCEVCKSLIIHKPKVTLLGLKYKYLKYKGMHQNIQIQNEVNSIPDPYHQIVAFTTQ